MFDIQKKFSVPISHVCSHPKMCIRDRLAAWGEILEDLADQSKSLYGILCNSQAFEMGEKLFIRSPNTAFAGMVQGKTALLSRIISDHTGKQYRLLMKGAKQQAAHSAVDEVLERAKQSGIDVIEE